MKVADPPGGQRVRRAAKWGKTKYAGSVAEDLWRRLDAMDFINQGMLFAATLLLCFFPFLITVSALAGRPVVNTLARSTGLNGQAAADVGRLFAPSAATVSAVVGSASMVFFVLGGIAAATALQEIYERAFELPHRGMKDIPRRLAWLAVLIGASLLTGRAAPALRHAGGPVLLAAAGLVWATGFWWLTMRILLAGRISWRTLFPAACATGVLYVAMEVVFSLVFSAMVISNEKKYGPIGVIFALLSYLIAIGVVVILGAVVGLVWQERSSAKTGAGHLPLPAGTRNRVTGAGGAAPAAHCAPVRGGPCAGEPAAGKQNEPPGIFAHDSLARFGLVRQPHLAS
jgi:membrane protein